MRIGEHLRLTGTALKRWLIARSYNALIIGAIWLLGLLIVGVPFAPFWAFLGGALQFIPNLGPVLALIGPAIAAFVNGGFYQFIYVLMLYAAIAVVDGLILDPYLMRRTARVPIWASILTPIVLGIFLNFWGVLISAPLLAIIYAYRTRNKIADNVQSKRFRTL